MPGPGWGPGRIIAPILVEATETTESSRERLIVLVLVVGSLFSPPMHIPPGFKGDSWGGSPPAGRTSRPGPAPGELTQHPARPLGVQG